MCQKKFPFIIFQILCIFDQTSDAISKTARDLIFFANPKRIIFWMGISCKLIHFQKSGIMKHTSIHTHLTWLPWKMSAHRFSLCINCPQSKSQRIPQNWPSKSQHMCIISEPKCPQFWQKCPQLSPAIILSWNRLMFILSHIR